MRGIFLKFIVGLTLWIGVAFASNLTAQPLLLGIDVLERNGFSEIRGQRVGLLTHPAGVNRRGTSTIEVLRRSPRVNLVALYGPEHGIYGDEKASVPVDDKIDARTGLPVYSLYGKYRKPTPKMLADIDVLVIDLQDIGVRSYTFISCMRKAIEACFEEGKEVLVLDRPNPLGGVKVAGPPMDIHWKSYVGAFQIPYVHGLTIGEIALMAKRTPGWLEVTSEVRETGRLRVVNMQGWRRSMLWPETGLEFKPTSPYIPDVSAVMGYAMTGLGAQLGSFSHGIGTPYPFRFLRFKGKTPQQVQAVLTQAGIPGLSFPIIETKTTQGAKVTGVYARVDDFYRLDPLAISFHMMRITAQWEPRAFTGAKDNEANLFNKHVGSTAWWDELTDRGSQARVEKFLADWERAAVQFRRDSQPFWLYN